MSGGTALSWPVPLEQVMGALANPARVQILAYLCEGCPRTRVEIARRAGETIQFVGHHLQVLVEADLATAEPGPGRAKLYAALEPVVIPGAAWAELPAKVREGVGARIFSVLHDEVRQAMGAGNISPDRAHLSLIPMAVDEGGVTAIRKVLKRTADELLAIQEASSGHMSEGGTSGGAWMVGLIGFRSVRQSPSAPTAPLMVTL